MARRVEKERPADTIWKADRLYFKKRWPVDVARLDPSLGTFRERSLGTGDLKTAEGMCATHRADFEKTCERVRAGGVVARAKAASTGDVGQDWVGSLTPDQQAALRQASDKRNAETFGEAEDAESALARLHYDDFQAAWLEQTWKPAFPPLAASVLGPAEVTRLETEMVALFRASLARSAGVSANERLALGYPAEELPKAVRDAAATLTELTKKKTLKDGLVLRTQGIDSGRYRSQMEWSLRLFHGIVGEKSLEELKREDLSVFETALRRMPSGRAVQNAIRTGKKTVKEVIADAKPGVALLAAKSVAKHVEFICSISDTAFGRGLGGDKHDPLAGYKKTRIKKETKRQHFIPSELDTLFKKMGEVWLEKSPDYVWICLLALFHGARREEICQLLKSDICKIDGVLCLNITTRADDDDPDDKTEVKRLKTENAIRVIPIHQRIIDAGFLDYVNASPGPRVFASLKADKDGRLGGPFGRKFGTLRNSAGIKGDRDLVFHSFRHTAITAMRASEWPYHVALAVSGHAGSGNANDGYGAAAGPKVTKPWVDKLAYAVPAVEAILTKLTVRATQDRHTVAAAAPDAP